MKKVLLMAGIALLSITVNAQEEIQNSQEEQGKVNDFKKWKVRVRGVSVVPIESAEIGVIGGDIDISNTFIPELDFSYFLFLSFFI